MIDEEILEDEKELTKIESKAIDSYIENIYTKKVPEPVPPTKEDLSFWKIAGIEATLFTIAGIAIAIYSSIRTGGLFYIMETLLLKEFNMPDSITSVFSIGAMITSLGAFELFVLADGFSKGKENKTLKRSNIGLYSSLGVIVLAGIFTGFGLIPNLAESFKMIFYIVIAVFTAVAGGLVALYSGENIGFTFLRVERTRDKLIKNHSDNYQKWKEGAIKSYQTSRYAIGSKKSAEFMETMSKLSAEYKTADNQIEVPENMVDFSRYTLSDDAFTIYKNIVEFVKINNRLPTKKELVFLGKDEKTTFVALGKFIINYEKTLLKNKKVKPELIDRAKKYLEDNKNQSFFYE